MKKIIVLLFAISLALSSCNSDPTSVARKIVAQKIETESLGYLKLKDFTKINAEHLTVFGEELYQVDYQMTLEAAKDGGWVMLWNIPDKQLLGYRALPSRGTQMDNGYSYQIKKGEVLNYKSLGQNPYLTIMLKKTENGWVEQGQMN